MTQICHDHLQIATQGVYPGFSHFQMALNGFGCSVEIEIVPPQSNGGGSGGTLWDSAVPYEIIIRVRYKNKTWEERKYVSALAAKSLEKVLASFKSFRTSVTEITAKLNSTIRQTINVFVHRK